MTKILSLFIVACLIGASASAVTAHETASTANKASTALESFTLSIDAELVKDLPRTEVTAASHEEAPQKWEGVALIDVLRKAKAPVDAQLRGKTLAMLVRITAADGYQVVFSLGELDSGFGNTKVLLVDKQNGEPLPSGLGPFRLVVPGDKRAGRWVWNVQKIELLNMRVAPVATDKK